MIKYSCLTLLFILCLITPATFAQTEPTTTTPATVPIVPDKSDSPLLITGTIGEENSFTGNLRLTAEGADTTFSFLASDLYQVGGDERIGRENITLIGGNSLSAGTPQTFQITIAGITTPATYTATLELLQPNQLRQAALTIPLTVTANIHPTITPITGSEQLQLNLVNCGNPIGANCLLTNILFPASATQDNWQLQFDNPAKTTVPFIGSQIVARGEQTSFQLTHNTFQLPNPLPSLTPQMIATIPITLNLSQIPPDRYTGNLYFRVQNSDSYLTIPLTLNIRTGPLLPALFLIIGILVGRTLKYMQERGQTVANLLNHANQLTLWIEEYPNQAPNWRNQITTAQNMIYRGQLPAAQTLLDTIHRQIEKAQTEQLQSPPTPTPPSDSQLHEGALIVNADNDKTPTPSPTRQRLLNLFAQLQYAWNKFTAYATLLLSKLIPILLLIGLLYVGLETLYINSATTFGANPFQDYLGLILWGLSTDVAGRTLSDLSNTLLKK